MSTANKTDATESKQVFDVAKPGKASPDATGRPLIVGHKPLLTDPMVTPDSTSDQDKTAVAVKLTVPRAAKVLAPITPDDNQSDAPASKETSTESNRAPASDTSNVIESDETAVMEAIAGQAGATKKSSAQNQEDEKQQEEITRLIQEKILFVPITQAHKKRNTQIGVLLVLLIIVVVAAVLAIDAGIVETSIQLPFDLIQR